jgi:uncharacterized membrane protein
MVRGMAWAAPIPPPEVLERYERIVLGAARRMVAMAEREQEHRHDLDRRTLDDAAARARRGQWMALVAALAFLVGGVIVTVAGHPAVGGVILGAAVVSVGGAFAVGHRPPIESACHSAASCHQPGGRVRMWAARRSARRAAARASGIFTRRRAPGADPGHPPPANDRALT